MAAGFVSDDHIGHDAVIDSMEATVHRFDTGQPEADGTAAWDSTTVVVVRVRAEGLTGTGWTYGPAACAAVVDDLLSSSVVGQDAMSIPAIWLGMVRSIRNATRAGVCGYAISAVDVACWDLKARLLGVSLADLFGRVHQEVPVYGSGGFTTYTAEEMAQQLRGWVDQGIPRVKIKIGESRGTDVGRDRERIRAARRTIGPEKELYVDANGAYSAKQAVRVFESVSDENVTWFEEPVSSDDLQGLRSVRSSISADVAAGEYGSDIGYFERMCAAGAVDCLQIDATRSGGYTEWLRAAAIAAGHELDVSAHCAPNLHAPVAAATPNLRHVEWFSDHVGIEQQLFHGASNAENGVMVLPPGVGHAMTIDEECAAEHLVLKWVPPGLLPE